MRMLVLVSMLLALPLVASACGPCAVKPVATPTAHACARGRTVVLVRHAEKASAAKDASLSDRGRERANALASMFGHAGVTRLIATQYKRTQETLAPLAQRVSLPVDVRDASATQDLLGELRAAPDGSFIVVATHSNVLPLIVRELAGATLRGVVGDTLAEDDFSRVVVIAEPCGAKPSMVDLSSGDDVSIAR